jgi:hypothetical protein
MPLLMASAVELSGGEINSSEHHLISFSEFVGTINATATATSISTLYFGSLLHQDNLRGKQWPIMT